MTGTELITTVGEELSAHDIPPHTEDIILIIRKVGELTSVDRGDIRCLIERKYKNHYLTK